MTFTEAAVEVLRLVGKPLHYKRITEIAIERNLLSHVGKTPEVTMSSRLATMVKRDRGEAPIIKVKPGVFALREFSKEQLADLSGDISELPSVEAPEASAVDSQASQAKVERRPLPGADVFPEEEDDDEPIFGAPAESANQEAGNDSDEGEGRSSKRRRRRRKRGRGDDSDDNPQARDGGRDTNRRRGRDRDRDRDRDRGRDEPFAGDWQRESADGDLVGKDLADAVASVLQSGGRSGMTAVRVAERLVRKGRLSGDPAALVPTLGAAVRADLARARGEGARARFRLENGRVVLVDSLLPQDVVRAEQETLRAAERQRERARRAFLRKLSELPFAGLAELLATWLNAEGVVSLRAVRRPGAAGGELHMAGTHRRGLEEIRLAIVCYRDGRDLGRERVIELRGALHHYGNASAGWVLTLGQVLSGAREEATAPGTAPISLFDGAALAAAMERVGVGVTRHQAVLNSIDFDLLDALSGSPASERRARDERDEEPDDVERRGRSRRGRGREQAEEGTGEEEATEDAGDDADESASEGSEGSRRSRRRRRRRGRGASDQEAEVTRAGRGEDDDTAEGEEDETLGARRHRDLDAEEGPSSEEEREDRDTEDDDSDDYSRRAYRYPDEDMDEDEGYDYAEDEEEGERPVARYRDDEDEYDDSDEDESDDEDTDEDGESEDYDSDGGAEDSEGDSDEEEYDRERGFGHGYDLGEDDEASGEAGEAEGEAKAKAEDEPDDDGQGQEKQAR